VKEPKKKITTKKLAKVAAPKKRASKQGVRTPAERKEEGRDLERSYMAEVRAQADLIAYAVNALLTDAVGAKKTEVITTDLTLDNQTRIVDIEVAKDLPDLQYLLHESLEALDGEMELRGEALQSRNWQLAENTLLQIHKDIGALAEVAYRLHEKLKEVAIAFTSFNGQNTEVGPEYAIADIDFDIETLHICMNSARALNEYAIRHDITVVEFQNRIGRKINPVNKK